HPGSRPAGTSARPWLLLIWGAVSAALANVLLPPYALELFGVFRPLVHEPPALPAALGPVFLAHRPGLELRAFAHRALARVVARGLVDGHRFLRSKARPRGERSNGGRVPGHSDAAAASLRRAGVRLKACRSRV